MRNGKGEAERIRQTSEQRAQDPDANPSQIFPDDALPCYHGLVQHDHSDASEFWDVDDDVDSSYLDVMVEDFKAEEHGCVLPVSVPDHTDLHRFDVAKLRPFEILYVDNKDYPCMTRGGKLVAFVLVDLKTLAIFKVDVRSKKHNGLALRKLLSENGVHKLPYKCTVYADNCPSMAHVQATTISMGLDFQPLPPKDQSLNLAEKAIHIVFYGAVAHLVESKRDTKYFPQAVDFACYSHMRTATTESRAYLTPFEAIKGVLPDVSHMRAFGSLCYPVIDKDARPTHKGTCELHQPGVKGIFLGYHTIWSTTYMVVIDEPRGTVVHSRHVLFNLESPDYRPLVDAQPPPPSNDGLWGFFDPPGVQSEEAKEAPVEVEEANSELASSPGASSHSQSELSSSHSQLERSPTMHPSQHQNSGALSPFQWSPQDPISPLRDLPQEQSNLSPEEIPGPPPRYPTRIRNPPKTFILMPSREKRNTKDL
jgi:hypothetical protein